MCQYFDTVDDCYVVMTMSELLVERRKASAPFVVVVVYLHNTEEIVRLQV